MSDDIVVRLRECDSDCGLLLGEAATEIEKLRALLWKVPRDLVEEIDRWQLTQDGSLTAEASIPRSVR